MFKNCSNNFLTLVSSMEQKVPQPQMRNHVVFFLLSHLFSMSHVFLLATKWKAIIRLLLNNFTNEPQLDVSLCFSTTLINADERSMNILFCWLSTNHWQYVNDKYFQVVWADSFSHHLFHEMMNVHNFPSSTASSGRSMKRQKGKQARVREKEKIN